MLSRLQDRQPGQQQDRKPGQQQDRQPGQKQDQQPGGYEDRWLEREVAQRRALAAIFANCSDVNFFLQQSGHK
jgi:hypothetical protein